MNILDKIIDYKRKEVAERKQLVSESLLRENDLFKRPVFSLKEFLLDEGKQVSLLNLNASRHQKE